MNKTATIIKIGAVVTATPRWVAALLLAEGFVLPASWLVWWVPVSAILSAGMALTEALAFSFLFEAWRNQQDKRANTLLILAIVSGVIFVAIIAPYVVTSVRQVALSDVLPGVLLWIWAASVAASTIIIVASIGYAQKMPAQSRKVAEKLPEITVIDAPKSAEFSDWRQLPDEDKALIAGMTTADIVARYAIPDRTARNWRRLAQRNGHENLQRLED